jgi:hypothetical protein
MGKPALFVIAGLSLSLVGSAAQSQFCKGCSVDTRVPLRDSHHAVRGYLQIVGSGPEATVQFSDADGNVLVAPLGQTAAQLPQLEFEPDPDAKTDAASDIKYLQDQIFVLQRNVRKLQDRVNGLS